MYKISIIKNEQITNQAQFSTEAELNEWLSNHESMKSFGEPAYSYEQKVEISSAIYEAQQVEIEPGVFEEQQVLVTPAVFETQVVNVPASYEIVIEDVSAEIEAQASKQAKIDAGKAARETCEVVLDFIAGSNLDKSLTIEQITQMQATFSSAESALRSGRPTYAKMFISAIEPDGVILTEEEKSQCLLLLAGY